MAQFSSTPYLMIRRKRRPHLSHEEKAQRMRQVILQAQEMKRRDEALRAAEPKLKPVIKVDDSLEGMPVLEPTLASAPTQTPPPIRPKHKGRQILNRHAKA